MQANIEKIKKLIFIKDNNETSKRLVFYSRTQKIIVKNDKIIIAKIILLKFFNSWTFFAKE